MSDSKYIQKRKAKAKRFSILFLLMRIFPINKKKIVFSAFEGDGGFCCNPKYIAEELHKRDKSYQMIWLTHDTSKAFPDFITPIKDTTFNTAYHLSTAKIWIDNYRKPFGTLKRKGQFYIQTWHATIGFKAVGLFRGDAFPPIARLVSEWDSNLADYILSNSDYCDRIYPQKLLYTGPTLKVGSPRVDCIIKNREKLYAEIRHLYGLNLSTKILIYAPTFRGGDQKGKKQVIAEVPTLDFDVLLSALAEKFRGEWKIFLRLHPQLSAFMGKMPLLKENDSLIDVSKVDDISELLAASDIVITDYSSCAFDAAFAHIPVFLYADDVQEYISRRGQFMWKREELPFSISETNEELINNIKIFSEKTYIKTVNDFMKKHGVIEDGHSSERVADIIEKIIYGK